MRMVIKLGIWVIAVLLVIFVACGITVALFGKKMLVSQLEKTLQRRVTVESISFSLPLAVRLRGLEISRLLKVKSISFTPGGTLSLSSPEFRLEQSSDGTLNLPRPGQAKINYPPLFFTRLKIEEGRFIFVDRKVIPDGFTIVLDKIDASVNKAFFPLTALKFQFKASGLIADVDLKEEGSLECKGWVDWGKKDMQADFKIKGLNAVYFSPYYGNFISQRKLLSARVNFTSRLDAKDNNLNIASHFRLSDLVYAQGQQPQEKESPRLDLTRSTLDLFTDSQGNLDLDFGLQTKLDHPDITIKELKKAILQAALKNLSNQPPQELFEKINRTIEQFKDFGKEIEGIFKGK